MGFLEKQAQRLQRESWSDINELAQEIYAIFHSDGQIEFDSPIVINNTTGAAPITINHGGTGDETIVINREVPANPPVPGFPDPDDIGSGDQYVTIVYADGTIEKFDDPPPEPEKPQRGEGEEDSGGGGGFPGEVVSGSGDTYQVDVYEGGLDAAPVTRTVTQLEIHPDEQIPAGTWALVGKLGDEYFMQVPVWAEDEEGA